MTKRRCEKHQCMMAYMSIVEFMDKHMPHNPGQSDAELLIETLTKLNEISSMIKAHPDYNTWHGNGIHRNSFYMLKNMIVYFVYTICTPYDACNIPHSRDYKVRPGNIYTTPAGQKLYELIFTIDGTEVPVTAAENPNVAYGYLDEFFDGFTMDSERNVELEKDYSAMTPEDVKKAYDSFLAFLMENGLFFTMFYDIRYTEYMLEKYVLKDSMYAVHLDPTSTRSKMSFFGFFRVYVYRYNNETGRIEAAAVSGAGISAAWSDPKTEWMDVEKFARTRKWLSGLRKYRLNNCEYDFPMIRTMSNAVKQILTAALQRKKLPTAQIVRTIIKNKNEK